MKTVQLDTQGRSVRDCRAGESGVIAIQGPVCKVYKPALREMAQADLTQSRQAAKSGE